MRPIIPLPILLGFLLFGCQEAENNAKSVVKEKVAISSADKVQIQALLRQALHWADSKNAIALLPVVTDSKDSVYLGVNLAQHKQNLAKLQATNFFSPGFIANYNHLVLAIDAGMRSGQYEPWLVGDGPTIVFVSEVNAWCSCQDVPYDNPNPWDNIEISLVKQDKTNVEVAWHWGKLELLAGPGGVDADPGLKEWQAFSYKVLVTKETGKWKIAYLQGFDFKEGTRQYL
ncbi:MAG: hypothetical protein ACRYG7_05600 [Janthinobacterium lividum]